MEVGQIAASLQELLNGLTRPSDPLRELLPPQAAEAFSTWYEQLDGPDEQQSLAFELAAKETLHEYSATDSDGFNTSVLLDCVYYLGLSKEKIGLTLVHNLIEEVLDIQTITWCEHFWNYMKSRESVLCKGLVGNKSPGLTLIRYCNRLTRRLSKHQHSRFSAAIAMFLTRAFPLNEKSGLNLRGEFDKENVTVYDEVKEIDEDGDHNVERDSRRLSEDEIYEQFWSMQSSFMDPSKLFNNDALREFKSKLKNIISVLRKSDSHQSSKSSREALTARSTPSLEDTTVVVPKWLTNKDLFELQLNDPVFRRAILLQILILCDFLLSLSGDSKKTWPDINAVNKAVMYGFSLSDEDVKFFAKTRSQLRASQRALDLQPGFLDAVQMVLNSDIYWSVWKLRSCPSFISKPMSEELGIEASQKLEAFKKPRRKFWHTMGTAALTKAWKIGTGLDRLVRDVSGDQDHSAFSYYQKSVELRKNLDHKKEELSAREQKLEQDKRAQEVEVKKEDVEVKTEQDADIKMEDNEETEEQGSTNETIAEPLVSMEELKEDVEQLDQDLACANWRGLRAARDQGFWARFSEVDKVRGFAGLFEKVSEPSTTEQAQAPVAVKVETTAVDSPSGTKRVHEDAEEGSPMAKRQKPLETAGA